MAKSYCLTVDVKSDHIENGLAYKIAFRLPLGTGSPDDLIEFAAWQEDVQKIVQQAGDQCFHSDVYTKKLAIAGMMHDLAALNKKYTIQAGGVPHVPAVIVHSSNPFDNTLEINFSGHGGAYKLVEKAPHHDRPAPKHIKNTHRRPPQHHF